MYRTVNQEGKIVTCNETYAKNLGYTVDEVIGISIFDHVSFDSLSAMKTSLNDWKKTGNVKNREIWMKRKDSTTFPVLLSAGNLYDNNKNIIGSHTIIRDISEIYEAKKEAQLEKTKRLAAIGQLSARLAHDMRNPLSVIRMSLDNLRLLYGADKSIHEHFKKIDRSIDRMTHQIDDVLDFVSPKPLNLKEISLLEILKFSIFSVNNNNIINVSLPQNDYKILCDPKKLEIVFVNLMINALYAGGDDVKINVKLQNHNDELKIEIRDNGPGIPEDIMPEIFEPLFTTKQVGTGLGLTCCKTIIEEHGGIIYAENIPQGGANFIIKLPATISNQKFLNP